MWWPSECWPSIRLSIAVSIRRGRCTHPTAQRLRGVLFERPELLYLQAACGGLSASDISEDASASRHYTKTHNSDTVTRRLQAPTATAALFRQVASLQMQRTPRLLWETPIIVRTVMMRNCSLCVHGCWAQHPPTHDAATEHNVGEHRRQQRFRNHRGETVARSVHANRQKVN